MTNTIMAGIVAIATLAAVTVLTYFDKIDGQTAVALISTILGVGVTHVTLAVTGPKPPPGS